jgi:hypothetical protein
MKTPINASNTPNPFTQAGAQFASIHDPYPSAVKDTALKYNAFVKDKALAE